MMAHWLGAAGNALISARSALLACGRPCAERVSFYAAQAYPGYEGDLTDVAGGVMMTHLPEAGSVHLNAILVGVDPRCTPEGSDAPNGCGIHIHSGYDCADADTIGGHLYAGGSDPWTDVTYEVRGPGRPGTGADMVAVGMGSSDLIGRAFVVHDFDGERIACGHVAPPAEAC